MHAEGDEVRVKERPRGTGFKLSPHIKGKRIARGTELRGAV